MRHYWRQRKLITPRDSNVTTHLSDPGRRLRNPISEIFYSSEAGGLDSSAVKFCISLVTYWHVLLACTPALSNEES